MSITINEIKVKIKLLNSETILAQATLIISDEWEEHGWKVLKSKRLNEDFQEYIWIQAPSYKTGGIWRELVFINNGELYEQVLSKIYDAYHMAKTKKEGQESSLNEKEEVNIDEIP